MNQGTKEQAVMLAKQRWARLWPFDLEESVWQDLFSQHQPGIILQAIKKSKKTRNPAPAAVFQGLMHWIDLFEDDAQAHKSPSWPPPETNKI